MRHRICTPDFKDEAVRTAPARLARGRYSDLHPEGTARKAPAGGGLLGR